MVQDHSAQPLPDISPITLETKNWAVVIDHGRPACGFDPSYGATTGTGCASPWTAGMPCWSAMGLPNVPVR